MNKQKILVIEDNIDIGENIVELLSLSGFDTIEAVDGREGAKFALQELPDLILCDIMMPGLDGYGVLHILSKHRETHNIPFIFLTAKAEKSDMRKGMTLGADDYITKPFDETDLLTAIENRLKKSANNQPFDNGREDLFEKIFEKNKQVKSYDKKEYFYREEDTPRKLFFIHEGKVKISKINKDGREVVLELYGKGDFFGYWGILEDRLYNENAQALENCVIYEIPMEDFKALLSTNTTVSASFLKLLSNNMLIKEDKIIELAYESVRKRIANSILAINDVYGNDDLSFKVSRELIASIAGTTIPTTIRMITEFKNAGLINTSASLIQIVDYDKLKNSPF
ncbi:response regulator [Bacteroidia bacterium]|nr:response regulator [Bacteroidia bacterium]MDC0560850.1 response regulator [Bacteroidia bacterium]